MQYTISCLILFLKLFLTCQKQSRDPNPKDKKEPPVRFGSVPDFSTIHRFGSVRFGQFVFPFRRDSACVFRTRRGSVRFGSVRFRVRFRPVPKFNGWVWFDSARPVRFGFLFLPDISCSHQARWPTCRAHDHKKLRQVHLLRVSLLRVLESNFPGDPL